LVQRKNGERRRSVGTLWYMRRIKQQTPSGNKVAVEVDPEQEEERPLKKTSKNSEL
jgi:hypothetical protein